MISFSVSLVALILGYLLYGRFVERMFGPDDRTTPAVAKADGLDFMVLSQVLLCVCKVLSARRL